jgi:hypothetical protein
MEPWTCTLNLRALRCSAWLPTRDAFSLFHGVYTPWVSTYFPKTIQESKRLIGAWWNSGMRRQGEFLPHYLGTVTGMSLSSLSLMPCAGGHRERVDVCPSLYVLVHASFLLLTSTKSFVLTFIFVSRAHVHTAKVDSAPAKYWIVVHPTIGNPSAVIEKVLMICSFCYRGVGKDANCGNHFCQERTVW